MFRSRHCRARPLKLTRSWVVRVWVEPVPQGRKISKAAPPGRPVEPTPAGPGRARAPGRPHPDRQPEPASVTSPLMIMDPPTNLASESPQARASTDCGLGPGGRPRRPGRPSGAAACRGCQCLGQAAAAACCAARQPQKPGCHGRGHGHGGDARTRTPRTAAGARTRPAGWGAGPRPAAAGPFESRSESR